MQEKSNLLTHFNHIINEIIKVLYSYNDLTGFFFSIVLILCGIILAFWGYKLQKIALVIIGFLFGAFIGLYIEQMLSLNNPWISFLLIMGTGLAGAITCYLLYYFAIAFIGFLFGLISGIILGIMINLSTLYILILSLVLGVLVCFLSIKINKIIFVIITSYYGYLLVKIGLFSVNIFHFQLIILEIIAIFIFIIGMVYQLIDSSNNEDKNRVIDD